MINPVNALCSAACLISRFMKAWKNQLMTDPRLYTGLYSGIHRVAGGTAKKPEKVLKEWCARTENRDSGSQASELCRRSIRPAIEANDGGKLRRIALRLLAAAKGAGIHSEETQGEIVVLEGLKTSAYIHLDDGELYEGDRVEIVTPAWYLGDAVVEQGYCRKRQDAAEQPENTD